MRLHAVAMAGAALLMTAACADTRSGAQPSPVANSPVGTPPGTPPGAADLGDTSSGGTPTTGPVVGSDGRGTSGIGEFVR